VLSLSFSSIFTFVLCENNQVRALLSLAAALRFLKLASVMLDDSMMGGSMADALFRVGVLWTFCDARRLVRITPKDCNSLTGFSFVGRLLATARDGAIFAATSMLAANAETSYVAVAGSNDETTMLLLWQGYRYVAALLRFVACLQLASTG
jgi:hypothetical protein